MADSRIPENKERVKVTMLKSSLKEIKALVGGRGVATFISNAAQEKLQAITSQDKSKAR